MCLKLKIDDDLMIWKYLEGSALLTPRCCTRMNGTAFFEAVCWNAARDLCVPSLVQGWFLDAF